MAVVIVLSAVPGIVALIYFLLRGLKPLVSDDERAARDRAADRFGARRFFLLPLSAHVTGGLAVASAIALVFLRVRHGAEPGLLAVPAALAVFGAVVQSLSVSQLNRGGNAAALLAAADELTGTEDAEASGP